jgi:hypothetical protein
MVRLSLFCFALILSAPASAADPADKAAQFQALQAKAAEVEARLGQSSSAKSDLLIADTDAEAKAILLKHGFSAQELDGVKVRLRTRDTPGSISSDKVKVALKTKCCSQMEVNVSW